MFELAEESFDEISVAVQEAGKGRDVLAPWHRLDVGPSPTFSQIVSQPVTVIGPVGQQDLTLAEIAKHIDGAGSVVGLSLSQFECDWQAVGVYQGMDFGRQAAPRATHATGSVFFFWALAAC
jgi:hypothetical protein